jgi:hypothetical protein
MEVRVLKSISQIVWCVALLSVLGLIMPDAAAGGGQGSGRGGGGRRGSPGNRRGPVASKARPSAGVAARAKQRQARANVRRPRVVATKRRGQGGPLSYNAYWRAATSPVPPRPTESYNTYWQTMQAQKEYQQRLQK